MYVVMYFTDGDINYISRPYFIELTAGMTHFPFNVSMVDDNQQEGNFSLTIDKPSLPCDVAVGYQDHTTITMLQGR